MNESISACFQLRAIRTAQCSDLFSPDREPDTRAVSIWLFVVTCEILFVHSSPSIMERAILLGVAK